jgi:hypothetical protein
MVWGQHEEAFFNAMRTTKDEGTLQPFADKLEDSNAFHTFRDVS